MAKYKVLDDFYKGSPWINFRLAYINERLKADDGSLCDYCYEYIDKSDDITLHHEEELTPDNVHDAMIALNPDNIKQVHAGCHNKIHKHSVQKPKKVFMVCGPPLSGKTTLVQRRSWDGDLIIDIDDVYIALSGLKRYHKPDTLLPNAKAVMNLLIDHVKTRYGKWDNAWIIGGYPEKYQREKLAADLGATIIMMDTKKEDCIMRLKMDQDRKEQEWTKYINRWFARYTE